MGLFDLFGKEQRTKSEAQERAFRPFDRTDTAEKAPVSIFSPTSYEDVETIIDALKVKKNVVVHLTKLKPETAIRILDMLSGAVYALGGGVYEMEKNIYMFSPAGVEIN